MDIVEVNKLIQRKKIGSALDHLYELCDLTKDESLTLILNACKKEYGLMKTVKIVHGLGVKNL